MPTRNVVLTVRHEQMIEALVRSGRYQNASEVLRDGLRLVEAREAHEVAMLAALRDAARQGEDDLAAGRYREFTTADDLTRHLASLSASPPHARSE